MNFTNQQALEHINSLQNIACELSQYGVVRVTGSDSEKLLQGQLTCDVSKLTQETASVGAFCNVQGRIHAVFYIMRWADDFLLIMPREVIEHFIAKLSMYAVFFQTEISDATEHFKLWGSCKKSDTVQDWEDDRLAITVNDDYREIHLHSLFNASILICEHDKVNQLDSIFMESTLADHKTWDYVEIQSRIPMVYANTIEQFLPHFIGLEQIGGISFDKGCYTGQEIVARMHYRGKLKTHATLGMVNGELIIESNSKIVDLNGKNAGEVIRTAPYDGKTFCLLSLADKALESSLTIENTDFGLMLITE